MVKEVKGFNLDAYMMALEGWRRGLTLTWYYDSKEVTDMKMDNSNLFGKTFSLYSNKNNQIHYFYRSRGDRVANEAASIVNDRHLAKKYFEKAGVPTANGVTFEKKLDEESILQLVKKLAYPLVVKPTMGSMGKGVITDIQDEIALLKAVQFVNDNYEYDDIIVEQHQQGNEYRVYVVGDQVIAATKRIPANVTGNGRDTIDQLIATRNEERQKNPYLKDKDIEVDDIMLQVLKENNLTLKSVPSTGETIPLKSQGNISIGGKPIDVTEDISEHIQHTAIDAVKAIPNLVHAGVDLIVNDEVAVIKVVATADIGMHVFPVEGKSRNVPAAIMDYYFSDTKQLAEERTNFYFDYPSIHSILQKKFAQELTLTDATDGKVHTARYIISGKVQKVGYRAWVRKQAIRQGLHGYTRNLENGRVVVVVGGNEKAVGDFKKMCQKGPARAKVKRVKELEWESPIKLGFEIRTSR
jgi:D-alanine-D-alanine ligase-like ATP-grasp enzyme/acylphosphatase